jgi:DNA repair protein RadD
VSALQLREAQLKGVEMLREGFAAGHRCQMLYLPTGGGKTEIAISMMSLSAEKGRRSAMILDRRNLVNQTSQRLDKYRIPHGVLMAQSGRMHGHEKIQICSAQTLEKRGASMADVLFVDEAHQIRTETKRFIERHPELFVVGLSASPLTKGLGKTFTRVVSPTTTNALVADNLLVMPTIYCAREIDMEGAKKVAGEWSADDVGERATKITGDIVATYLEKTQIHFGGPVKTLVHCASVAHGAELAQKFAAAGLNFVAISYKDDEDFKLAAYEEFAKADSKITGLIAVDMLTKGFDVPDVLCSIMARPFSKSVSSVIQQCGRVMRTAAGKIAAILIDHAGNFLRHGEQIFDIFENGIHELDDGAEKPAKEKTIKEKEACKCPKCQALWRGATDTCSQCGYVRPSRSKVQQVSGTVEEFARSKIERAERQSFYSQLLGLAQDRGYADGWAAHKFKEKFDVFPNGLAKTPEPCGPKVASYVRSRQISWAKSSKSA